ncbi:hypothetical protein ACTXG7_24835 [Mycolicibacterium sp. Dal123E01]
MNEAFELFVGGSSNCGIDCSRTVDRSAPRHLSDGDDDFWEDSDWRW